jgi:hypothetical protein
METKSKENEMSEENAAVTEPEDDAVVVDVDPVVAEEKANDELVADVTKLLEPKQEEASAGEAGEDEKKEPSKDDEPGELSQDLLARAESAGISTELAERLHQNGQLDETLSAFDRRMIDYVQSKDDKKTDSEETPKSEKRREQEPPPKVDQANVSPLNPEDYDEEIVKRDALHQQRIDTLEARIDELFGEQQSAFDKRFDSMVDGLKQDDLFGKGDSLPTDKQANRDTLFKAYNAVCLAYDVDPNDCKPEWVERALGAMFPKEVFKQAQQQTVDRLSRKWAPT